MRQQQIFEPVAQFFVKINQWFLCADPTMSEEMKLFFWWPHLWNDISRHVQDQGPISFHIAIQISKWIEATFISDLPTSVHLSPPLPWISKSRTGNGHPRALPQCDAQGKPKCFYCNTYGHIKKHWRNLKAQQHHQNVQLASLAELLGNTWRVSWRRRNAPTTKPLPLPVIQFAPRSSISLQPITMPSSNPETTYHPLANNLSPLSTL